MKFKKIKLGNPLDFFRKLSNQEKNISFLHTATKKGKSILAFDPVEIFQYKKTSHAHLNKTGSDLKFLDFAKKHLKQNHKLIGYFSYDYGLEVHEINQKTKDDLALPDIYFCAYDNFLEFENNYTKIFYSQKSFYEKTLKINQRPIKISHKKYSHKNFQPEMKRKYYDKSYEKIIGLIKAGEFYQINFTHRLKAKTTMPPRELFIKVVEKNPVEFLAYIEGENFEILSASPERFIKIKNKKITTCPIKGTKPLGQKKELLNSKKEAAELNMITDLLRNDLGKVSEIGSVKVTKHRAFIKCPTIWHTYSEIIGTLNPKYNSIQALISMLSGGSITGCPKKRAMEVIDNLEKTARSVYTGIIGYIDPNYDLDFNIAIRTIIKKNDNLYLQVGGGIVIDSKNHAEYEETLQKASSFMKILC